MYTFLLALMVLLAVVLVVIILLQAGKGGGLASTFGGASSSTDSVMGTRQAATALTKLTWVGGGLFLVLGLVLSVLSSGRTNQQEASVLEGELQQGSGGQAAPTSVLESERSGGSESGSGSEGILPGGGQGDGQGDDGGQGGG